VQDLRNFRETLFAVDAVRDRHFAGAEIVADQFPSAIGPGVWTASATLRPLSAVPS
jgi:hypothetical protein